MYCASYKYELLAQSGHEAGAASQTHWPVTGGEGGPGEAAAAGRLVVVGVVEVNADWPLGGWSPLSHPGPLCRPVGQGDAQVILNRDKSYLQPPAGAEYSHCYKPPVPCPGQHW